MEGNDAITRAIQQEENTETFLNSYCPLEMIYDDIPLTALRQKGRLLLSRQLNPTKILPSEEGYARDWRGLAHLVGVQNLYGPLIGTHNDPMSKLLQVWCKESDSDAATFGHLIKYLGFIDRWDVIDDLHDILADDTKYYITNKPKKLGTLTISKTDEAPMILSANPDADILTIDDVLRSQQDLPPQKYDAFVLFADEDIDFATEIIERMEESGLKFCVKERDLIGDISFEHEAILRLISERCNRLIVVVSNAFLQCPANTFFVNFAQALGIEQGRRKIVPCLYENCTLPATLRYFFCLNYQRSGKLWNFWDKLKITIQNTPNERSCMSTSLAIQTSTPRITITDVTTTASEDSLSPTSENSSTFYDDDAFALKTPVKSPRKQKTSTSSQDTTTFLLESYSSASSVDLVRGCITPEQKISIMPPRPRMRTSTSLIDVRAPIVIPDSPCLSVNAFQLRSSQSPKKQKWYKKILSPSSIPNDDINVGIRATKEKSKRKWFRKKIASYA